MISAILVLAGFLSLLLAGYGFVYAFGAGFEGGTMGEIRGHQGMVMCYIGVGVFLAVVAIGIWRGLHG